MDIGQRIRERREYLGLTQDELAKKLGYAGRSSVNKVENSREVSMKKIEAYAKALETTVSYLMGWENNAESADMDIVADIVSNEELYYMTCEIAKLKKENNDKFEKLKSYMEFLKVGQN